MPMNPPFTGEQFLNVFRDYNNSVWPMQIVFYAVGFLIIIFAFWKNKYSDIAINGFMAFFWLWMGIVYHLVFFTAINKAAYIFGAIFIIQASLFVYFGLIRRSLTFSIEDNFNFITGLLIIIYAFAIYPIFSIILGHHYPAAPTLGLPCPTTIFTLGLLLWMDKKLPLPILFIPALWSFIGFMAVLNFGILEDAGLLISGIVAGLLVIIRHKKKRLEQGI
jgi:hypothetical protein